MVDSDGYSNGAYRRTLNPELQAELYGVYETHNLPPMPVNEYWSKPTCMIRRNIVTMVASDEDKTAGVPSSDAAATTGPCSCITEYDSGDTKASVSVQTTIALLPRASPTTGTRSRLRLRREPLRSPPASLSSTSTGVAAAAATTTTPTAAATTATLRARKRDIPTPSRGVGQEGYEENGMELYDWFDSIDNIIPTHSDGDTRSFAHWFAYLGYVKEDLCGFDKKLLKNVFSEEHFYYDLAGSPELNMMSPEACADVMSSRLAFPVPLPL